jgi:ferrochelatase
MKKTGIFLLNLGTPESYTYNDVRKYLREFLSDYRVINLPWLIRFFLVNFIITPWRAWFSAKLYKSIWTAQGSPLLVNSINLQNKLQSALGENFQVETIMRYGQLNAKNILPKFDNKLNKIIIISMFPQYSSAASGSSLEAALQVISKFNVIPDTQVITKYYDKEFYLDVLAKLIKDRHNPDFYLLFSFHGLPTQQLTKIDTNKVCHKEDCPPITYMNDNCYRAQCFATAKQLAAKLNVQRDFYSVSFQSRLGKIPWIEPYLEPHLDSLYLQGVRKLSIVTPSFSADCLETLEEVAVATKEYWLTKPNTEFNYIECLNDNSAWVQALASKILNL